MLRIGATAFVAGFLFASSGYPAWAQQNLEALFGDELRMEFLAREKDGPLGAVDPLTTGAVQKREEIFKYCLNISDAATETRTAVLANHLKDMGAEVDEKLKKLDERISVLRDWMVKRQLFLDSANESLIKIFASMRPRCCSPSIYRNWTRQGSSNYFQTGTQQCKRNPCRDETG